MRWIIGILMMAVSSASWAEGTALLISDNRQVETSWDWCLTDESLGLTLKRITSCYDCCLTSAQGLSADVGRILSSRNIAELQPDVVFLQLGCNDRADSPTQHSAYESTLFDYPNGKVCNLAGANVRHKTIAVSKDNSRISNANFAGSIYRIVDFLRNTAPDARIFLLPSVKYGQPLSADDSLKLSQQREVANMLCIPYVDDWNTVRRYDFIWKHSRPHLGRILLLGDSYCQLRKWTDQLERLATVDVLTNLGKTSATLKDRGSSTNTLSNQLSRIPPSCNPDVIIIEGGINDEADPQRFVDRYEELITQPRRTNFAGALSYIVKWLQARYPKARIYVVTPGGLYYGHTDQPFDFIVKANQIRRAAYLIGVPTIDWDREGRLTFAFNNSRGTGNGSEASPFIYNVPSRETGDLLHPNEVGAVFLAENVIKELRQ